MKNTFSQFKLSPEMQRGIAKMGFKQPTMVQSKAIQPMLDGHDLLVQAPTGTGKTCAFGIPAIEEIDPKSRQVQAIVLCPTRELAIQTTKVLHGLTAYMHGIRVLSLYGGVPIGHQINSLKRKPQVIVATPGRLMDHMRRRTVRLSGIQLVVLDEADRMLDMGFRGDIQFILKDTPKDKQVALFSATISPEIQSIASQYQKNPVRTAVEADKPSQQIQQYYNVIRTGQKTPALLDLLSENEFALSLVFVRTRRMTVRLARQLKNKGYQAEAFNGDLRQGQRDAVMRRYRSGKTNILVATDIAARGIDVNNIDAVINYDIPESSDSYIHRIGRTGRAKEEGLAYTFIYPKEQKELETIMQTTKNTIVSA